MRIVNLALNLQTPPFWRCLPNKCNYWQSQRLDMSPVEHVKPELCLSLLNETLSKTHQAQNSRFNTSRINLEVLHFASPISPAIVPKLILRPLPPPAGCPGLLAASSGQRGSCKSTPSSFFQIRIAHLSTHVSQLILRADPHNGDVFVTLFLDIDDWVFERLALLERKPVVHSLVLAEIGEHMRSYTATLKTWLARGIGVRMAQLVGTIYPCFTGGANHLLRIGKKFCPKLTLRNAMVSMHRWKSHDESSNDTTLIVLGHGWVTSCNICRGFLGRLHPVRRRQQGFQTSHPTGIHGFQETGASYSPRAFPNTSDTVAGFLQRLCLHRLRFFKKRIQLRELPRGDHTRRILDLWLSHFSG